ncbi:VaFE repeat-containing surface-anchored protein [Clostridium perfringens]|nr:VaFE repeat-containing surface-anchored protein [Clostridium perfringens]
MNFGSHFVFASENPKILIKFSNTESNTKTELKGASFKVVKGTDPSGPPVDGLSWVSDGKIKEFKLEAGTYTLVQVSVPKGYIKADPITFTVSPTGGLQTSTKYKGYTLLDKYPKEDDFRDAIYIEDMDNNDTSSVVYCFNVTKATPTFKGSVVKVLYNEQFGSSKLFTEKAIKPRVTGDELKNSVLRVIYNGYPSNALGIKEKYQLTEGQFRKLTQRAVWNFTDSNLSLDKLSKKEIDALNELINAKNAIPDNLVLNLYLPDDTYYQNLLGTKFVTPNLIKLENEKLPNTIPEVKEGTLRTTVTADGVNGSSEKEALVSFENSKDGVDVKDTINYEGLVANEKYNLTGKLMHVKADGSLEEVATKTTTVTAGESGSGTWELDFGNQKLQVGEKYVVFENAESVENLIDSNKDQSLDTKQVVKHEDKNDKAQTLVVEKPTLPKVKDGTLRTTVTADGVNGSSEKEALVSFENSKDGVDVKDTINYEGLVANEKYNLTGKLMHVKDDGSLEEIATKTTEVTAGENGSGTWELDFGNQKLQVGEKYVVFENAESVENLIDSNKDNNLDTKQVVKHEDKNDKAQTLVVEKPTLPDVKDGILKTTVAADGVNGSSEKEALVSFEDSKDGVDVKDTINYEGLVAGQNYTLTGTLMHVKADGSLEEVATKTTKVTAGENGNGTWELDFGNQKLQVGEKYVVFENAESVENLIDTDNNYELDTKQVVKHEDKNDKAQTLVVEKPILPEVKDGTLKTTVTADGVNGSSEKEALVSFEDSKDGVNVKDTINYESLVANEKYNLTGKLMHVKADGSLEEVATKTTEVTAGENGNGTWQLDFGNQKLLVGEKYVVFENAESVENLIDTDNNYELDTKQIVKHEDKNDKAQTLVVEKPTLPEVKDGTLRTTVTADGINGSSEKEALVSFEDSKDGVDVKDTINYEGLVAGQDYTLTGTLMHVKADGSLEEVATKTAKVTADENGNGTWELDFGNQKLQVGEKYVVFENAESVENLIDSNKDQSLDTKQVVKHEDKEDKAQTLVVEKPTLPEVKDCTLRTTVTADGVNGSSEKEALVSFENSKDGVDVKDTINYEGLVAGQDYTLTGTLMHVKADGSLEEVATKTTTVTAGENGSGTWELDFGNQKLQVGEKYVVFENAESVENLIDTDNNYELDAKQVVKHEDKNDKAQTLIVEKPTLPEVKDGTLRTTVTADGVNGSSEKEALVSFENSKDGVDVKDTINYEGLVAGQDYTLTGTLMHVKADGSLEEVATKTTTVTAGENGSGTWELDFGNQKLKVGEKYVVFENAESVENLIDTDNNYELDTKQIVKHEDKNDKAQTLVVEKPTLPEVKDGTLKTTVTADEVNGSSEKEALVSFEDYKDGVDVKDTINYEGLVANEKYNLTGKLMHVKADGSLEEVATKTTTVTAGENGTGTWELDFGNQKLQVGEKYVVFENAESVENLIDTDNNYELDAKQTVKHEDKEDKAQTLIVEKPTLPEVKDGTLRTTVTADEVNGSSEKEALVSFEDSKDGVDVKDTINYEGLVAGQDYTLTGTLMHVKADGSLEEVATKTTTVTAGENGTGTWELDFGNQKLQVGEKYVVFESVESVENLIDTNNDYILDAKQIVKHENKDDKAQTLIVETPKSPTTEGNSNKDNSNKNNSNLTKHDNYDQNKKELKLPKTGEGLTNIGFTMLGIIILSIVCFLSLKLKKVRE